MDPPQITWIASYAKSGNTWMRLFLTRILLGDAWSIDEAKRFMPHILDIARPNRTFGAEDLRKPETLAALARLWGPMEDAAREALGPRHRGRLRMKTHDACVRLDGLPFPAPDRGSSAIYIVRDPRDVAISLAHHLNRPLDDIVGLMIDRMALMIPDMGKAPEFWSDWGAHIGSWRDGWSGALLFLRYEDLVADPAATFRRVLAFLDWRDDDAAIDAAIAAVAFDRLQAAEAASGFAEAPADRPFFRRGVAGGWRDDPRRDALRRLEDAFAQPLAALGYA